MTETTPLDVTPELTQALDSLPDDVTAGTDLSIDMIPVGFPSAEALEYYVANLLFFDENLHPLRQMIDWVFREDTPPLVFLQFNQEMWVVQRLLTIQRYLDKPEHLKGWLKGKLTQDSAHYEDPTSATLQLSKLGSHMSPADFEQYRIVFEKLYELHKDKLAKSPLPDVQPDPSDN